MFNIGVFMGWSDVSPTGESNWAVLIPVYLGCIFWTVSYETIYQHQVSMRFILLRKNEIQLLLNYDRTAWMI